MYKLRSFLTQYCVNDVMTREKILKILKLATQTLPVGFDLFSLTVLDVQIWASFDPILEWRQTEGLWIGHHITILKNLSEKWITILEKTIVIKFDLFITVGI